MAPVPAGQPGVRLPGGRAGARPARRRLTTGLAALAAAALALLIGWGADAFGGGTPLDRQRVTLEILRIGGTAVALFGVVGFGLTRLLLPDPLRHHQGLWVLPVGAAATALGMGVLGYAGVPFEPALAAVVAAGGALSVRAWVRRTPMPRTPGRGRIGWPLWIGVLVVAVALVPMVRAGFATTTGNGSDAVLAVGTAEFLQDHHPGAVAPEEPLDQVPLVWRSKPPIYYALGAVAQLSGMEVWQSISVVAALLLALMAIGFFVLGRELLGAPVGAAALAMGAVALDRMVLHTVVHPYFNQTWGMFALPFGLVAGWAAVRNPERRTLVLLGLFTAILGFAYPLALPILAVALAGFWWAERRRRRNAGEPVVSLSPTRLWRGPRTLLWAVPLAVVLAAPLLGVFEKVLTATRVLADPRYSLSAWGGDVFAFFPEHLFFGLPSLAALAVLAAPMAWLALRQLRRAPRAVAVGLGALLVSGFAAAAMFRMRDVGWYFHFKVLAFVAPLAVVLVVVSLTRLGRVGVPLAVVALLVMGGEARTELAHTHHQVERQVLEVRQVDALLPAAASVRLDMWPPEQLWVAHFLPGQPLCSERPLLSTNYPRVPTSRRADYVLVNLKRRRPRDAVGMPLWRGERYALYRLRAGLPGPERCSRRLVERVTAIT